MKTLVGGVTAALMLAFAGQAAASPQLSECGGQFTAEQSCSFTYSGGSIGTGLRLGGDPFGVAVVRLEAEISAPALRSKSRKRRARAPRKAPVQRTLLTCQTFGAFGVCGSSQAGEVVPVGTTLNCVVTGKVAAAGSYRCYSGTNEATGTRGEIHP